MTLIEPEMVLDQAIAMLARDRSPARGSGGQRVVRPSRA
jgi:hypothetical protein